MKKEFAMPIIVLSLICLFVTGALAISHSITQPVIAAAAAERAAVAMREMIPHAESFKAIKMNFPGTVYAAYRTTNDVGYIFITIAPGFAGDVRVITGMNSNGTIIRVAVLSHTETPTFAAPVFAESHIGLYSGQDRYGIEGISGITGSTVTVAALRNAVRYAFSAFELVMAGGAR